MSPLFARIVRILEDRPEAFEEPITWYSNGERGHLHTTTTCEKVRRSRATTRDRKLTVKEALDGVICDECGPYRSNFTLEQRRIDEAASRLADIENRLRAVPLPPLLSGGCWPLLEAHRLNCYLGELLLAVVDVTDGDQLPRWTAAIRASVKDALVAEPDREALHEELLRATSVEVLRDSLSDTTQPPSLWGGQRVLDFFGSVSYRDWRGDGTTSPLAWFAREWMRQIALGQDPREVLERLRARPETFTELVTAPRPESFQLVYDLSPPRAGESLQAYVARSWSTRAIEELEAACSTWSRWMSEQLNASGFRLLAASHAHSSRMEPLDLVGVARSLVREFSVLSSNDKRFAICAPPIVAAFLAGRGTSGRYSSGRWSEAAALEEGPDTETVEAALLLWEPYDRNSIYHNFGEAYAAAAAL